MKHDFVNTVVITKKSKFFGYLGELVRFTNINNKKRYFIQIAKKYRIIVTMKEFEHLY